MSAPPKRSCEEIREQLSACLDGELDPAESREVEAHLRECTGCAAALEELRGVSRSVAAIPSPRVPAGFKERLLNRIDSEGPGGSARVAPLWVRYTISGLAASFLLFLALRLGGVIGGSGGGPAGTVAVGPPPKRMVEGSRPPPLHADRDVDGRGGRPAKGEAPVAGGEVGRGLLGRKATEESVGAGGIPAAPPPAETAAPGGRFGDPALEAEADGDVLVAFARDAPKNQTFRFALEGGEEGLQRVREVFDTFQAPEEERPQAPPAPAEPEGVDAGAAEEPVADQEKEVSDGDAGDRSLALFGEAPREPIVIRITRKQYPHFLYAMDQLSGVRIQDGPEQKRWALFKPQVIPYLQQLGKESGAGAEVVGKMKGRVGYLGESSKKAAPPARADDGLQRGAQEQGQVRRQEKDEAKSRDRSIQDKDGIRKLRSRRGPAARPAPKAAAARKTPVEAVKLKNLKDMIEVRLEIVD